MYQRDSVLAKPWTGDYRIDSLIEGPSYRWNFDPTNPNNWGEPTEVTFGFMLSPPPYSTYDDQLGFQVFDEVQRVATRSIFDELGKVLAIDFSEIDETGGTWGSIRLGNNKQSEKGTAGYAYLPNDPNAGEASGDIYLAREFNHRFRTGDPDLETLIHEIGHALGLIHPITMEPISLVTESLQRTALGPDENTTRYTVMSYEPHPQQLPRIDWGLYDLLVLRHLYGIRAYNPDDDSIQLDDMRGRYQSLIVDDGGTDLLDLSQMSLGATINLNPGSFSSIGRTATGSAAVDNIAIAFGTLIEQLKGTSFTDLITGNDANNRLEPLSGYDSIDGGSGIDTVIYDGPKEGFWVSSSQTRADDSRTITVSGQGFANKLTRQNLQNVERIEFSDISLAFDLGGNAGLALKTLALLYGTDAFSPQLCGLAIRYIDEQATQHENLATVIAGNLVLFEDFWGAERKKDDRSLVTLLASRLELSTPDSPLSNDELTNITDYVKLIGGQENFLVELLSGAALDQAVGITIFSEMGLPWV